MRQSERTLLVIAERVHTFANGAPRPDGPVAVLVIDGMVAAMGPAAELRATHPAAPTVDLSGATLTPGLIDSHIHLTEWALARQDADLSDANSPGEVADRMSEHARRVDSDWVRGRGWNPHRWDGQQPHRRVLDNVVPGRPVVLQSHDMHSLWVNGEALRRAAITDDTADPAGGRIVRDADGQATGLLLENAAQRVTAILPAVTAEQTAAAVIDAQTELHGWGITGVHTLPAIHIAEPEPLSLLAALRDDGRLRLRVVQHMALDQLDHAIRTGRRSGSGDDWVRFGAVKMFLDGALGSRTAWMREPYAGSDSTGIQVLAEDEFRHNVRRAALAGMASVVHAIGDAAVDLAFSVLSEPATRVAAMPHRIEHVQCCPPEWIEAAGRAGISCSMQPAHLITDWRVADRHWGRDRARLTYAFRSLLDAGALLAFGSDAPVEPADPRLGLHAAVNRTDPAGSPAGGWYPEQRLTVEEALAGYTRDAARAVGWGGGVIRIGTPADMVAWRSDPLDAGPHDLLGLECIATIVNGDIVHSA